MCPHNFSDSQAGAIGDESKLKSRNILCSTLLIQIGFPRNRSRRQESLFSHTKTSTSQIVKVSDVIAITTTFLYDDRILPHLDAGALFLERIDDGCGHSLATVGPQIGNHFAIWIREPEDRRSIDH